MQIQIIERSFPQRESSAELESGIFSAFRFCIVCTSLDIIFYFIHCLCLAVRIKITLKKREIFWTVPVKQVRQHATLVFSARKQITDFHQSYLLLFLNCEILHFLRQRSYTSARRIFFFVVKKDINNKTGPISMFCSCAGLLESYVFLSSFRMTQLPAFASL